MAVLTRGTDEREFKSSSLYEVLSVVVSRTVENWLRLPVLEECVVALSSSEATSMMKFCQW